MSEFTNSAEGLYTKSQEAVVRDFDVLERQNREGIDTFNRDGLEYREIDLQPEDTQNTLQDPIFTGIRRNIMAANLGLPMRPLGSDDERLLSQHFYNDPDGDRVVIWQFHPLEKADNTKVTAMSVFWASQKNQTVSLASALLIPDKNLKRDRKKLEEKIKNAPGRIAQRPFYEFRSEPLPDHSDKPQTPEQEEMSSMLQLIEDRNRSTIKDFNPNEPSNSSDIILEPAEARWNELIEHDSDHRIALRKRDAMLRRLGIPDQPLDPNNEDVSEYIFSEGDVMEVVQFHHITQDSGEKIPVLSTFLAREEGRAVVATTRLLSHDVAASEKAAVEQRAQEITEVQELNKQFLHKFHFSESFLNSFNLSMQEKRDMLVAYDDIEALGIDQSETGPLTAVRQKMIDSIRPQSKFDRWLKLPARPEEAAVQYEQAIAQLAATYNLDPEAQGKLLKSEQLLRMQEINMYFQHYEQGRMGKVALGFGTIAGGFAGVGAGKSEALTMLIDTDPSARAVVGGVLGLIAMKLIKTARLWAENDIFFEENTPDPTGLRGQLQHEKDVAEKLRQSNFPLMSR